MYKDLQMDAIGSNQENNGIQPGSNEYKRSSNHLKAANRGRTFSKISSRVPTAFIFKKW